MLTAQTTGTFQGVTGVRLDPGTIKMQWQGASPAARGTVCAIDTRRLNPQRGQADSLGSAARLPQTADSQGQSLGQILVATEPLVVGGTHQFVYDGPTQALVAKTSGDVAAGALLYATATGTFSADTPGANVKWFAVALEAVTAPGAGGKLARVYIRPTDFGHPLS